MSLGSAFSARKVYPGLEMSKQKFLIRDDRIKANCLRAVQSVANNESKPMVVEIRESTRNDMQNRKFHAMCNDISEQCEWCGWKMNPYQWKRLFVSGHSVATGEEVKLLPGIEGELFDIREKTAKMSVKRMASLIEYVQAWASGNGVRFTQSDTGGFYG